MTFNDHSPARSILRPGRLAAGLGAAAAIGSGVIAWHWRRWLRLAAGCLLIGGVACEAGGQTAAPASPTAPAASPSPVKRENSVVTYPETRRGSQVDDYFGTRVADPYRWLEDTESDATAAWVAAQNRVTFEYLKQIPQREPLTRRLTELWNYERFGLPHKRGGRYFYTRNDGLQNQSVLYVADSLEGEPRLLLDPNSLSADGTVALANWEVSDDGRYLAYGLASAGSDWREWRVLDIASGKRLEDHLKWVKFSGVSWTPDNQGFFYSRYDEPEEGAEFTGVNYYQKLFYHKVGDPQSADQLIYQRADEKEWGFDGEVSEDGRFVIISIWRGTERKNQIFYRELNAPSDKVVELLSGFDAEYQFLGNDGTKMWFLTDRDAPLRRVIEVDVTHPREIREVLGETSDVLRGASVIGGKLVAVYLKDAQTVVRIHDLQGRLVRDVKLPGIGTAGGFGGRQDDDETFYSFTNFTTPATIFRYDVDTGESTVFRKPQVAFDPAAYETRQVFYESRDGTRVPMFITHRKGLKPEGQAPTVLYGYGGFNISLTPSFSVANLVWLEQGGIYAVPNLRGGGEYGRDWHEAGMKANKQKVFDDFLAAADWLVAHNFTSPARLAIRGGSNGGLLVGAAMTQAPGKFAAAVPAVGVMDMLRYHKFTIGWAWVSEYGSSENSEEFANLFSYSPLHNLKPGTAYPATLVTTGDHDDRVVPGHSFKFAAALQHAHRGPEPVLIRIETSAGHGAGTPTSKRIEAAADVLAFLFRELITKPQSSQP